MRQATTERTRRSFLLVFHSMAGSIQLAVILLSRMVYRTSPSEELEVALAVVAAAAVAPRISALAVCSELKVVWAMSNIVNSDNDVFNFNYRRSHAATRHAIRLREIGRIRAKWWDIDTRQCPSPGNNHPI